ncbi:hypothetical protein ACUY2R_05075 [Corynebacterium mastitidis]
MTIVQAEESECLDCIESNSPDSAHPVTDESVYKETVSKVKTSIQSNALVTPTDIQKFDFSKSTVLDVLKDGEEYRTVTVPITGHSPLSNFTVVYNQDGTVSNYAESLFRKGESGNFAVDQWVNGNFHRTQNTDVEFIDDNELMVEIEKSRSESERIAQGLREERSFGKVVACLAGITGIGGPVAYIIASACAGACVAPEAISKGVCAACIGAYAALGAGGMGAAAACFQLW